MERRWNSSTLVRYTSGWTRHELKENLIRQLEPGDILQVKEVADGYEHWLFYLGFQDLEGNAMDSPHIVHRINKDVKTECPIEVKRLDEVWSPSRIIRKHNNKDGQNWTKGEWSIMIKRIRQEMAENVPYHCTENNAEQFVHMARYGEHYPYTLSNNWPHAAIFCTTLLWSYTHK